MQISRENKRLALYFISSRSLEIIYLLQLCKNNWIRRIVGVKSAEIRRMKDLSEEVGTKACIFGKTVDSQVKWAEHMGRMKEQRLPKNN